MTRIPNNDRTIVEKAIYLPMIITILNQDLSIIENSNFKLKKPYQDLIRETLQLVQQDLKETQKYLQKEKISVDKIQSDHTFTMYRFIYKGYEEHHNYFNPRLRNKTEEVLRGYLLQSRCIM